ncbi:MAG: hypothetical protein ABIG46_03275 [Candidatus Omnitrophota bacterium]
MSGLTIFFIVLLSGMNCFAKDSENIQDLLFTLDSQQSFLGGSSEKLILRDSNNALWMFKMPFEYYDPNLYFGVPCIQADSFIASFYNALGINKIQYYPAILSINGLPRYGNLLKLVPSSQNLETISFNDLTVFQRQFVQKVFILDWLLVISGVDSGDFIIDKNTGEIFTIDKEHAFRDLAIRSFKDNDSPASFLNSEMYGKFYKGFFAEIVDKRMDIDLVDIFKFIDSIQSINDELFVSFFTPYLKDNFSLKLSPILLKVMHEAQFEYSILKFGAKRYLLHTKLSRLTYKTTPREFDDYLKLLLARKKRMRVIFEDFYRGLLSEQGADTSNKIPKHKLHSPDIDLLRLLFKINTGKKIAFTNLSGNSDIGVIASERAWFLYKQDPPVFTDNDILIKELCRIKAKSPNERIAIELYIRNIEEGKVDKKRIILAP